MITASDLRGHWRRDWIKTPDRFDDTTRVHWLQGDGIYADIRVPLHRPQMDDATCLADLPSPVLADLMQAEGFAGDITVVDGVCTWARHINLHGLPAPVDAGAMWFQDDGALIEDGVHTTYRERWHGVATPPLNALSVEVDGLRIITVWNAHVLLVASGPLRHAADPHLICNALLSEREADIAMSPGVRWGPSLIPGAPITREDIFNVTSMTYGKAYRSEMTGEFIKVILEDVADNIFNPDPYYQQGGDMVRIGGMGYRIDISKPQGERISEMTLLSTGEAIDPAKTYVVAGWASVNEGTEGPQIWDVVESHIRTQGTVTVPDNPRVQVVGA